MLKEVQSEDAVHHTIFSKLGPCECALAIMSRGSGWEKTQWDEWAHWQEKPEESSGKGDKSKPDYWVEPEEPRGSRDDSKSKRKKDWQEDWQEDCRHWSKSQSYREQIRAPLLAQVKRMQKEMDNLVDRATDAEQKSLQAYTMLSALSSGVEARCWDP